MTTINAPLRFDEITAAQGISQDVHDLGHFAQGASNAETPPGTHTNRWAYHKPVRYNALGNLDDDMIASTHCGLAPRVVTKLLSQSMGMPIPATPYTKEECVAEIAEWEYLPPRGYKSGVTILNEWFRALDFDGYNPNAIPPDSGWSSAALTAADLDAILAATITVTATGDANSFILSPSTNNYLYTAFAMKFGFSSGQSVGSVSANMECPINSITGASQDGGWRIALAVYLPNWNDGDGGWGIFSSRKTIYDVISSGATGTALRDIFPDFTTNQLAVEYMKKHLTDNSLSYAEFTMVPLLIKNLRYTTEDGRFFVYCNENTSTAYCVPSGCNQSMISIGTPPTPRYWQIVMTTASGNVCYSIKNTDTAASHTFGYSFTIYRNGVQTGSGSGSVTVAAEATSAVLAQCPNQAGFYLDFQVTSQS